MNLFKALVSMFAESSFEDMVVQFAASKLQHDDVCLLISDANMGPAYRSILRKLKGVNGPLTVADTGTLCDTLCTEVLIVHSHFDQALLETVLSVPFVRRVVYVAENAIPHQAAALAQALEISHSVEEKVEVVFAYNDGIKYASQLKLADPFIPSNLLDEQ